MHPAPAGKCTFMPFPPRGTPAAPDLFALYATIHGLTLEEAIERLARAAGLLPAESAERKVEA